MWLRRRFAVLLPLLLVLASVAPVPLASTSATAVVTARLGISAGTAIQDVAQGTSGEALMGHIPTLFATAASLGVQIETVSVGQGFWSEDGQVMSEHDLDLVVTGTPDSVNAMAGILGRAWEQSVVLVWYPAESGAVATATIPLPDGAEALTDAVYQALVTELVDGGHVRYAGADSLIFVAKTGDEPDAAFFERMERVRGILEQAGIASGAIEPGSTEMVVLTSDNYEEFIAPRVHGKAA